MTVMLTQTGSCLSVMCSLLHCLPAVGLYEHTNKPGDVHTDTYTAGLPVSGEFGWALEALHVLLYSLLFYLPVYPKVSSLPSHIFHSLYLYLYLSLPILESEVRVWKANINKWYLFKWPGSKHGLWPLLQLKKVSQTNENVSPRHKLILTGTLIWV